MSYYCVYNGETCCCCRDCACVVCGEYCRGRRSYDGKHRHAKCEPWWLKAAWVVHKWAVDLYREKIIHKPYTCHECGKWCAHAECVPLNCVGSYDYLFCLQCSSDPR